jgi:hypothetical protein
MAAGQNEFQTQGDKCQSGRNEGMTRCDGELEANQERGEYVRATRVYRPAGQDFRY